MKGNCGPRARPDDRLSAAPLLAWVASRPRPLLLSHTDMRAIVRCRQVGYVDFYVCDRLATALGGPGMVWALYPHLRVGEKGELVA